MPAISLLCNSVITVTLLTIEQIKWSTDWLINDDDKILKRQLSTQLLWQLHIKQEQSETAYICPWEYGLDPESVSGYRLRIQTSLSNDTSAIKFSRTSYHSLQRYKPNCGKMPYLTHCWRILDTDPEVDDFRNLISSFSCTDTSVAKFLWRSV